MPERVSMNTKRKERGVNRTYPLQIAGVIFSFVAGLLALWLSLAILGFIGLGKADTGLFASPGLRMSIASLLALVFGFVALPLILPWLVAFLPAYLFIPRKSIFWNWWVCSLAGILLGIVALWTDVLLCSLLASGPLFSINVPLLESASIPAAVLGGAICFTAAISAKFFKVAEEKKRSAHGFKA